MRQYLLLSILFFLLGAPQISAQQLYWQEDGETSTQGQLANIAIDNSENVSTNFGDWFVSAGNIANQQVTTNRNNSPSLFVENYPASGTGNKLYTATLTSSGSFNQNNIEYSRRIGNPASGAQTVYFSTVFSVFQTRGDGARFPFGFAEIINSDGDPSLVTREWASRVMIERLSGDQQTGTFHVGVSKNGTDIAFPDLGADPSKEYSAGDVLVLVMKLSMDGDNTNGNDQLDIYVGPSVPLSEPTWDASISTGADAAVNGVFIREKMDGAKAIQDPFIDFGHIRVADSYEALIPLPKDVESITVSSSTGNSFENYTSIDLMASVLPENATDPSVTWSVENQTGAATITSDGVLTATQVGTVNVVATANDGSGVTGELQLTIVPNPTIIYRTEVEAGELLSGAVVAAAGCGNKSGEGLVDYGAAGASTVHANISAPFTGEYMMNVSFFAAGGSVTSLEFSSDGTNYTQLDFTGAGFCFEGPAGMQDFTINLQQGDNTIYFRNTDLEVAEPLLDVVEIRDASVAVTAITISAAGGVDEVTVSETLQMSATVAPEDATDGSITWSTDGQTGEATIDQQGLLTGVSAGDVLVIATANDGSGVSDQYLVTVVEAVVPVTAITISAAGGVDEVTVSETLQMSAAVTPQDATDASITWSTDGQTGEATIDQQGLLTGVSAGDVLVIATANDGSGVNDQYLVTVVEAVVPVTAITISAAGGVDEVTVSETLQMSAAVTPQDATDASITWSTDGQTGEATIDQQGLLTGVSAGDVLVIATANDGSGINAQYTVTVVEQVLSVGDLDDLAIRVYPNPTINRFQVKDVHTLRSIELINSAGRSIEMQKVDQGTYDISGLAAGVYFLNARTQEGELKITRIIKR